MTEQDLVVTVHYPEDRLPHLAGLTIRGDNLGLSWFSGTPLLYLSSNTWETTLRFFPASQGTLEFKILVNDSHWMLGENIRIPIPTESAKHHLVLRPTFYEGDPQSWFEIRREHAESRPAEHKEEAKASITLNLGSFNIRYGTAKDGKDSWENRKELVLDVFRAHHFDAVGVQEALDFQLDYIVQSLNLASVGVGRDDGNRAGEFSPIIFNPEILEVVDQGTFWLSDSPSTPGSSTFGNRVPRICTWARFRHKESGRHFRLYNTHLDHESTRARVQGSALIAQTAEKQRTGEPAFVTGDFNSFTPGSQEISTLKLAGFADAHAKFTQGTFHNFSGSKNGGRIDFIFIPVDQKFGGPAKVLEAKIIDHNKSGAYPSDHFPISASVQL